MDEPGGYLRRYDDDLAGALALVVHDVCTAISDEAEAEALVWTSAQGHLDRLHPNSLAGGEIALWVADQLQNRIIEDHGVNPWPECPDHPGTHPLWLRGDGAAEAWTCEQSGLRIELGALPQTPSR